MFSNYLKIAFRNLWKQRTTTFIKLSGLVAGLTAVLLIATYIRFELSYDRYNVHAKDIYRLEVYNDQQDQSGIATPLGLGKALQREFPEVKQSTVLSIYTTDINIQDKVVEANCITTENSIFSIFTLPFIKGSPNESLTEPYTAVISGKLAKIYFPKGDPVNQTFFLGNDRQHPFRITGVIKDIPANAHFHADIILSGASYKWMSGSFTPLAGGYTSIPQYVLLSPGADARSIEKKMLAFYGKKGYFKSNRIVLFPLSKIHLYSHSSGELEPTSDIKYIYILAITALLILCIACINFINLTTASSLRRTKEVGVRKVMGASQKGLRLQFLSEAYILFAGSALISLFLAHDILPWFSLKMNIPLSVQTLFNFKTILLSFICILLIGTVAGYYPAVFLSRLDPSSILKGSSKIPRSNKGIRRFLILSQFMISAVLIIATVIIYDQLHFISTKRLGFNKEQLLLLPNTNYGNDFPAFKKSLLDYNGVINMSISSWDPGNHYGGSSSWSDDKDSTKIFNFDHIFCDFDFLKTLQIKLAGGRGFSTQYASDQISLDSVFHTEPKDFQDVVSKRSILLNETAVKTLGLKNPIGMQLKYGGLQGTVVGIVKDFNGMSLHDAVTPLAIEANAGSNYGRLFIRIRTLDIPATIAYIRKTWEKFYPNMVFDFSFMDQYLQKLYEAEMRLGSLFIAFSILAICLSCLGIFGLAFFEVEQRTREMAIRKVLGASLKDILQLINKDFVMLVIIANLIAWPVVYILAQKWLNSFAYRINIPVIAFVIAIITSLILTVLTVSVQAWRAASANPIEALRSE